MGDPTPPACGLPGFVDRGVGAVRDVSCLGELNRRSAAIQLQQQSRGALAPRRPRRQRRAQAPARLVHRSAAPGVDAAEAPALRGEGERRGAFWRAQRRLLRRGALAGRSLHPFAPRPLTVPAISQLVQFVA